MPWLVIAWLSITLNTGVWPFFFNPFKNLQTPQWSNKCSQVTWLQTFWSCLHRRTMWLRCLVPYTIIRYLHYGCLEYRVCWGWYLVVRGPHPQFWFGGCWLLPYSLVTSCIHLLSDVSVITWTPLGMVPSICSLFWENPNIVFPVAGCYLLLH